MDRKSFGTKPVAFSDGGARSALGSANQTSASRTPTCRTSPNGIKGSNAQVPQEATPATASDRKNRKPPPPPLLESACDVLPPRAGRREWPSADRQSDPTGFAVTPQKLPTTSNKLRRANCRSTSAHRRFVRICPEYVQHRPNGPKTRLSGRRVLYRIGWNMYAIHPGSTARAVRLNHRTPG